MILGIVAVVVHVVNVAVYVFVFIVFVVVLVVVVNVVAIDSGKVGLYGGMLYWRILGVLLSFVDLCFTCFLCSPGCNEAPCPCCLYPTCLLVAVAQRRRTTFEIKPCCFGIAR